MLSHPFDQNIEDYLFLIARSQANKDDDAFITNLVNPVLGKYLKESPKLTDDFTFQVYGKIRNNCFDIYAKN